MPPSPKKGTPTQSHIPFGAVYQDTIVMKGGGFRQIILVSSINFGLKSEEEQNSIVYAFQAALNSFDFPVQILIRSRQIDLGEYLEALKKKVYEQTNELIRYQTQEYIDFISRLISVANIMDKKFFVVVAANRPPTKQGLFGPKTGLLTVTLKEFETVKKELSQKVEVVQQGLASLGLKSVLLTTEQIIELMYSSYNITESMREKLQNTEELAQTVVVEEVEGVTPAAQPGLPNQPATNQPAANVQPTTAGAMPAPQPQAPTNVPVTPASQAAMPANAPFSPQAPQAAPPQYMDQPTVPAAPQSQPPTVVAPAPASSPAPGGYSAIPPLTPTTPNASPAAAPEVPKAAEMPPAAPAPTAPNPQVPATSVTQNVPITSGS